MNTTKSKRNAGSPRRLVMSKRTRKNLKRRMLRTGERFYAWHSSQMEAVMQGHCVYRRPDGKLVKATLITPDHDHGCGWDDMKYLGKVIGYGFGGLVAVNKPPPEFMQPVYQPEINNRLLAVLYSGTTVMPPSVLTMTCS